MNATGQYLIHLSNIGEAVASVQEGSIGTFEVSTKQPLKDINKFGLLHYSVPKSCDIINAFNRSFTLQIRYADNTFTDIHVLMSKLDYYNMLVSQEFDYSVNQLLPEGRQKLLLALDEVLQTTLNCAIMQHYDTILGNGPAGPYRINELLLGRISVIVRRQTNGRLKIWMGYIGSQTVVNANNETSQTYNAGVGANSGDPTAYYNCATPGGHFINNTGNPGNTHVLIGTNPAVRVRDNYPWLGQAGYDAQRGAGAAKANATITNFSLIGLSPRMQLKQGLTGDITSDGEEPVTNPATFPTRGRVRLGHYANNFGMPTMEMDMLPNLDPPSFMFLQLSGTGTRSKILGQSDERGGFAIPTPQSQYMSNFNNLPDGVFYHKMSTRYIPIVTLDRTGQPENVYNTLYSNKPNLNAGVGFNYDYIPINSSNAVPGTAGANSVRQADNYNCISAQGAPALSQLIRIGLVDKENKKVRAQQRFHMQSRATIGGEPASGFGTGPYRMSSVFTVSLIEPNYVFTSTENVTIQTFHIRLLWGDTSEPVYGEAANLVQFSLIASP